MSRKRFVFFVLTADVKNLNNDGSGRQNDNMKTKKKACDTQTLKLK